MQKKQHAAPQLEQTEDQEASGAADEQAASPLDAPKTLAVSAKDQSTALADHAVQPEGLTGATSVVTAAVGKATGAQAVTKALQPACQAPLSGQAAVSPVEQQYQQQLGLEALKPYGSQQLSVDAAAAVAAAAAAALLAAGHPTAAAPGPAAAAVTAPTTTAAAAAAAAGPAVTPQTRTLSWPPAIPTPSTMHLWGLLGSGQAGAAGPAAAAMPAAVPAMQAALPSLGPLLVAPGPGLLPGAPAGAAPDPSSLAKRKAGRPKAPDPRTDPTIPEKKARRIMANRESADRSKRRQKLAQIEAQQRQEELLAVHADLSRQIEEVEDLVLLVELVHYAVAGVPLSSGAMQVLQRQQEQAAAAAVAAVAVTMAAVQQTQPLEMEVPLLPQLPHLALHVATTAPAAAITGVTASLSGMFPQQQQQQLQQQHSGLLQVLAPWVMPATQHPITAALAAAAVERPEQQLQQFLMPPATAGASGGAGGASVVRPPSLHAALSPQQIKQLLSSSGASSSHQLPAAQTAASAMSALLSQMAAIAPQQQQQQQQLGDSSPPAAALDVQQLLQHLAGTRPSFSGHTAAGHESGSSTVALGAARPSGAAGTGLATALSLLGAAHIAPVATAAGLVGKDSAGLAPVTPAVGPPATAAPVPATVPHPTAAAAAAAAAVAAPSAAAGIAGVSSDESAGWAHQLLSSLAPLMQAMQQQQQQQQQQLQMQPSSELGTESGSGEHRQQQQQHQPGSRDDKPGHS